MPRGVPQIEVTFDVNSDGIMHVFAVETSSGKSEKITIKNDRGNLSTEDIDRMVAEVRLATLLGRESCGNEQLHCAQRIYCREFA